MVDIDADFVKTRRHVLGLTQRELAERAGLKQPLIAAIESGRRKPSTSARHALVKVLAVRPSQVVAARRHDIETVFQRAGLPQPRVFGSVARGDDDVASDLDLVVEFGDQHDITDLLSLEHELSQMLTVKVDIVDARSNGPVLDRARSEAAPL